MSGAKKGAVGLAAMLGLIGVRSADNCASAGGRAARAVGDDALRVGARSGDEVFEAGARAGRIEWGPPTRLRTAASVGEANDGVVEALAEGGIDVALEVSQFALPEPDSAPPPPTSLACPVPHDLTLEPELWSKFLDGFGIACAPKIFIGRAKGDEFEVGGTFVPVPALFEDCAQAGGVCFFVGCQGQGRCFGDARDAAYGLDTRLGLTSYVYALAEQELGRSDAAWVAFSPAPGQVTMLRRTQP